MKLTIVIITTFLLQVSARTSGQNIRLIQNNITLKEAFKEIKKQTGYNIFYNAGTLRDYATMDVSFENEPLESAIKYLLRGQSSDFTIKNQTVVISKKEVSVLEQFKNVLRGVDIWGRVSDSAGVSLPGATLILQNKDKYYTAQSNASGDYLFKNVAPGNYLLTASYVGYDNQVQRVIVNSTGVLLNLTLKPGTKALKEVAVANTGYQQVPKERATGSFELVDNKLFNRVVSPNILQHLEGT
ncbi:MAG TPA: carboxypeptidase regulatory-like domain-containing protein, partial [Pedobacter sp.]